MGDRLLVRHLRADRQVAKAKKLFHKHDKDGSGEIDKAELAGMFKELNLRLTSEMFDELVLSYWTVADSDVRYHVNQAACVV